MGKCGEPGREKKFPIFLVEILQGADPSIMSDLLSSFHMQCKHCQVECGSILTSSGCYPGSCPAYCCFTYSKLLIWKIGIMNSIYYIWLLLLDNKMCAKCLAYYLAHIARGRQLIISLMWILKKFLHELILNIWKLGLIWAGFMKCLRKCPEGYMHSAVILKRGLVRGQAMCIVRHDLYHRRKGLVSQKGNEEDGCVCVCIWHLIGGKGIQKHVK